MKVILLQELKGRGGEGDVVDVAPGFANNYLFPQKIAVEASAGNLKQLEQRKHNISMREENRVAQANEVKEQLEGKNIKIVAKVGEEGQLFGSITTQMIAEALKQETGMDVDKKRIDLKSAIKTAGEHEILISLYRDIKTTVKLLVGSDGEIVPFEETAEGIVATEGEETAEGLKKVDETSNEKPAEKSTETLAEAEELEEEQEK